MAGTTAAAGRDLAGEIAYLTRSARQHWQRPRPATDGHSHHTGIAKLMGLRFPIGQPVVPHRVM
jgi:hypothetical protein